MIKILNTTQIKELDAFTIQNEPIASIDLMERACSGFADWFIQRYDSSHTILVVCGTGNNGGDGLGIARLLSKRAYQVKVFIVSGSSSGSSEFKENTKRLPKNVDTVFLQEPNSIDLPDSDIIIDALFGSGLSRPLDGFYGNIVTAINSKDSIRIAVDMPSGLYADTHTPGLTVQAHYTATFQLPKLSFLLPESYASVGEWHVVDIGLSRAFISESKTQNFVVDETSIRELIRLRKKYDHKGDFGHALIVAGSRGKMGASMLATKAALRAGSGLVTTLSPKCGYTALQSAIPEAMLLLDGGEDCLKSIPDVRSFTSIGIGPGIGKDPDTIHFLSSLLARQTSPSVLDADALNILAENQAMQSMIFPESILTPHPGEFKRLVGDWKDDFERLDKQRALSERLKSIVVLKGAHTSISMPNGDVYFNTTGNPAMATGGSGDVLTGILTALLVQKYSPHDAAILGVYWHGLSGDLAAKNRHSIIASDIIEQLPYAFKNLLPF